MEQAETLILTSTMEEITEDSYNRKKENFKLELFLLKKDSDKSPFLLKEDLCIILGMALEEIATLCKFYSK